MLNIGDLVHFGDTAWALVIEVRGRGEATEYYLLGSLGLRSGWYPAAMIEQMRNEAA